MRTATNQVGFNVEILTPEYGWRPVGFKTPFDTRDLAVVERDALLALAPTREFRIMPALEARP